MNNDITIFLNKNKIVVSSNMKILDLVKKYNEKNIPVIGVKVNHEITSFDCLVKDSSLVEFLYAYDNDGNKIYKSGLKYVLISAINELYSNTVDIHFEHSIDKGIYFTLRGKEFDESYVEIIKNKMDEIIAADERFVEVNVTKKDAIKYFTKMSELEKAKNIQSLSNSIIKLYGFRNNYNYFYTDMPYSAGCLKKYDIVAVDKNKFVLMFPVINLNEDSSIPEYTHYPLNMKAFDDYNSWIDGFSIENVADVNYLVSHNKIAEFIHVNELYIQKNIIAEAKKIVDSPNVKLILLEGPSSSGKTTVSKKLGIALQTFGKKVLPISVDDYYLNQNQMPKEAVEKRDFESIDLIDIDLLNNDLQKLLSLEEVHIPTYDFTAGIKEFSSNITQIDSNTIIILEGIHAISNHLIKDIDPKVKYKIYISPFEPLTIDKHNHLSTIDLRLLRRIVRDNRVRAVNVEETLKCWHYVRKSEEENIFPYMNEVNSVINSALIYEVGLMKVYAEPLLYSVPVNSPVYEEAKRLIEFLKIFYTIPSEYVDKDSLLREFIGGSIYEK